MTVVDLNQGTRIWTSFRRKRLNTERVGRFVSVLARVGEPFFTTKEPGQGMGLGLFISRAVVEQVGGTLSLDSTQGSGTMVVITVPAFGVESGKP